MQSATEDDIPRERHKIAETHDFTISVEVAEKPYNASMSPIVIKIHDFEVSRAALNASDYFKRVSTPDFSDTGKSSFIIKEDDPAAIMVWLQILHQRLKTSDFDAGNLKFTSATAWHVLLIADKYGLDPVHAHAKQWFANWYESQSSVLSDSRELLYPCYIFDHAKGSTEATKHLAYAAAFHITESRPSSRFPNKLRLDQRVIRKSSSRSICLNLTDLLQQSKSTQPAAVSGTSSTGMCMLPSAVSSRAAPANTGRTCCGPSS